MKTAIYARVSTQDQAEQGTTHNQLDYLNRYCKDRDLEITETYIDDGVSGAIPLVERPGGARLLADAAANKFQAIAVYKLDRLGRKMSDIILVCEDLERRGVGVISATQNFDTTTPFGIATRGFFAVFAQLERDTIKERCDEGRRRTARNGEWTGGPPPFGYINNSGRIEIDDTPIPGLPWSESEIAVSIFNWVAYEGLSLYRVKLKLEEQGIPNPFYCNYPRRKTGSKAALDYWHLSTIFKILKNPCYKGTYVWNRHKKSGQIEFSIPPLCDEITWIAAQQALVKNTALSKRNGKRTYLLRGLVKCGLCGMSCTGSTYTRGPYYVCNLRRKGARAYPDREHCPSPYVPAIALEQAVWGKIVEYASSPDETLGELRDTLVGRRQEAWTLQAKIEALEVAIASREEQRRRVLHLYTRSLLDEASMEAQLGDVNEEMDAIRLELKHHRDLLLSEGEVDRRVKIADEVLAQVARGVSGPLSDEERQQLVAMATVGVVITPHSETRWQAEVDLVFGCVSF
jgi:site-specific DNA recombinase